MIEKPNGGPWAVFWRRNGRVASVPIRDLDYMRQRFFLHLIQIDLTGTQHFEVLGARKEPAK